MLIDTGLNVTQVAIEVGFKNLSHFSRRFFEEHGIRPSDVRKLQPDPIG
jgi:AraC-like DNA-binding protein